MGIVSALSLEWVRLVAPTAARAVDHDVKTTLEASESRHQLSIVSPPNTVRHSSLGAYLAGVGVLEDYWLSDYDLLE